MLLLIGEKKLASALLPQVRPKSFQSGLPTLFPSARLNSTLSQARSEILKNKTKFNYT